MGQTIRLVRPLWSVDDVTVNGGHVLVDSPADIGSLRLNYECAALAEETPASVSAQLESKTSQATPERKFIYYFNKVVFLAFAEDFQQQLLAPLNIVRTSVFPSYYRRNLSHICSSTFPRRTTLNGIRFQRQSFAVSST